MGLKQMIDKAMQGDDEAAAALPPVEISGEAHRAYAHMVRTWSGWDNATLVFGDPMPVSPFASCHRGTHVFKVNPDRVLLNPNRVLLTVNPFRMRQEAVLTGALLHEASHVRHSDWIPRTQIDADLFKHTDGSDVTKQEMALAKCLEEPRIEGIMAAEADRVGATGLAWTLRASAAHLVPMTDLSANSDQAILDLITSWALRAGRQWALAFHTQHVPPSWVNQFTTLMHEIISEHLSQFAISASDPATWTNEITENLMQMCRGTAASANSMWMADAPAESDTGSFMVDRAKRVLELLFPETPSDQMPMAGGGCGAGEGEDESNVAAELDESGDEAGEAGAEEPDEGEGEESSTEGAPGPGEPDENGTEEGPGTDKSSALAKALAEMEGTCKSEAMAEAKSEASATDNTGGLSGGEGAGSAIGGGWRQPTKPEREIKAGAERFLRDMIEPSVSSKVRITDQPSSNIDGAALSAWKAGGQVKAPRFFNQIKRTTKTSPPVKIAILVDVSASMDVLQKPSALLSWSLASACLDLRNFAGHGVQIESTLIHWGSTARVVQHNGEILPGIREVGCHDGTTAMDEAINLIEGEIPGFFDITDTPENRLLIQFTDWRLASHSVGRATEAVGRALGAGVNMLSIVPGSFSPRYASLSTILASIKIQRGRNSLLRYEEGKPEIVWSGAARALSNA